MSQLPDAVEFKFVARLCLESHTRMSLR
jgi:hypothetical protein